MDEDRPDRRIDAGQDALRLAQSVGEEDTGTAGGLVGPPPVVDRREDGFGRRPAIDGQAEGRLGNEGVGAHALERGAGGVRVGLVVTADDPGLATVGHAHLGRAEDVAGGVEGDGHTVDVGRHAVGQRLDARLRPHAQAQDALARCGAQVSGRAGAGVVAVGVGDDRARHRLPRIDEEVARGAVEAVIGVGQYHLCIIIRNYELRIRNEKRF